MPETIGYSVLSDFESGFLHQLSPSVWHYDLETAIRYETEREARSAANRRKSSLAAAVRVFRDDTGKLDYERLKPTGNAVGGSWIVKVRIATMPRISHYVTSAGKRVSISSLRSDAKGFASQAKAQGAVDMVNAISGWSAEAEQVTAEILEFPGRK